MPARSGGSMTIPAIGRANGANGTFWRSDLMFFNPSNDHILVSLRYAGTTKTLGLNAHETYLVSDILTQFGFSSGNGPLAISWTGSVAPVVTNRTYTTDGSGGTFGQSIDPIAAFSNEMFVPGLRADVSYRSNVGVLNGGTDAEQLTVSLLSAAPPACRPAARCAARPLRAAVATEVRSVGGGDLHQIAAHDNLPLELPRRALAERLIRISGDEVREHERLHVRGRGDLARFFRAGVIALQARGDFRRVDFVEVLGQIRLEHEHVRAFRVANQVRIRTRVAGDHDRLAVRVESIAERVRHRLVIDGERRHLHVSVVVHHSFFDDVRADRRAGGGMFLEQVAAQVNVFGEELQHRIGELLRSRRSVQLQRNALASELPRRVEEIGESRGVIGMEMREENRFEVRVIQIGRGDAHRRAASRVDDEPFVADDDRIRRGCPRRIGARVAGAEEDDFEERENQVHRAHRLMGGRS